MSACSGWVAQPGKAVRALRLLFSTDVYANYSDAKADAEGLNNVLILKLPVPVIESEGFESTDEDPTCDCELPGFFCCGIP